MICCYHYSIQTYRDSYNAAGDQIVSLHNNIVPQLQASTVSMAASSSQYLTSNLLCFIPYNTCLQRTIFVKNDY